MMRLVRIICVTWIAAITAGAETDVRIQGLQRKSEKDLLELMGARLTYVRSSPASPPLADDAAFMVRTMLHKDGYRDAEVSWRIAKADEIVLTVKEGPRLELGTVNVNGVPPDVAKRLARLFRTPAEKELKLGGEPAPFREEDVETGMSYVKQELNANGYWSAEATVAKLDTDAATGAVNVSIVVNRGESYVIANPSVKSEDGRGEKLLGGAIRPFVGKTATTANLNAMRHAAEQIAVSRGYPDAKIRMTRSLLPGKFVPEFSFDLGVRVRLGAIKVEGLQRTSSKRIRARVKFMEGDWYDEAAMNRRLRSFLATGAFSAARVETEETGPHEIDATLHFTEAKAREITLGAGAGSYDGPIFRAGYVDRNLFGYLWGLSTGIEVSGLGALGEASITNPWLFGTDYLISARIYSLIYTREGYKTFAGGLEGRINRKFGDHYTVDLLVGNSVASVSSEGLPESELGETDYVNPRIAFTQSLDFRDNPVLPTKGWHVELPLEFGRAVGDRSTSYAKAELSGGWYHQINNKNGIGLGGQWGVLVPTGDGEDLPIDLRYFNGGARSVQEFRGARTRAEGEWIPDGR